jgi:NAD(P)-dependent dehydrogenase (short-subunit alcohol dehydrogenase family)
MLKDKRVLVIGGSSGIGRALAAAAVAAQARVTIASRSRAKVDEAAMRAGQCSKARPRGFRPE